VTGKAEGENFCPGKARREKTYFLSFLKGWWWWFRQHSKECMQTNGVRVWMSGGEWRRVAAATEKDENSISHPS